MPSTAPSAKPEQRVSIIAFLHSQRRLVSPATQGLRQAPVHVGAVREAVLRLDIVADGITALRPRLDERTHLSSVRLASTEGRVRHTLRFDTKEAATGSTRAVRCGSQALCYCRWTILSRCDLVWHRRRYCHDVETSRPSVPFRRHSIPPACPRCLCYIHRWGALGLVFVGHTTA